ncbi:MAG: hypothetical protein KBG90_02835 [Lachnospira sp.]|nr:hypothetical protein [Lachnospira sp.]
MPKSPNIYPSLSAIPNFLFIKLLHFNITISVWRILKKIYKKAVRENVLHFCI